MLKENGGVLGEGGNNVKIQSALRVWGCNSKPLRGREKMDAVDILHDTSVTVHFTGDVKHTLIYVMVESLL